MVLCALFSITNPLVLNHSTPLSFYPSVFLNLCLSNPLSLSCVSTHLCFYGEDGWGGGKCVWGVMWYVLCGYWCAICDVPFVAPYVLGDVPTVAPYLLYAIWYSMCYAMYLSWHPICYMPCPITCLPIVPRKQKAKLMDQKMYKGFWWSHTCLDTGA